MIGSANHDGQEFPDPGRFDITRTQRNLAFGHGAHFCIGAYLARAEGKASIEAILPHLHRYRLADEPLQLVESQNLQEFTHIRLVNRRGDHQ
jgi:cytochrome P450